jgi:hypothetical protein
MSLIVTGRARLTAGQLIGRASETIPAFVPITVDGYRGNSSNIDHFGKIIGVTMVPAESGSEVLICSHGSITNPNWNWTKKGPSFVNGMDISDMSPDNGWSQAIGIIDSAKSLYVHLGPPILL